MALGEGAIGGGLEGRLGECDTKNIVLNYVKLIITLQQLDNFT